MTIPDDHSDAPAELLARARLMVHAAAHLIAEAELRLAAPLPAAAESSEQAATQRAEVEADARAAVDLHEAARETGQAAQGVMYAAVRRLRRAGASRDEIHTTTRLTKSLVKWIVDDKAEGRRARRRRQAEAGE